MSSLLTVLASQSIILLAISVHELGHYLAARCLGVQAESFNIGIGPGFALFTSKGTQFRLSPLLIGGYVEYGEGALSEAHPFKRLLITAAGPLAGLVAALVLLWLIGVLYFNCTAWQSVIASFTALGALIEHISVGIAHIFVSIAQWLGVAATTGKASIVDAGRFSDNYTFIKTTSGQTYLTYLAGVSVALSVLNLLPIPPLDGGRIVLDAIELVSQRRLPLVAKLVPALLGIALLLFGLFASLWNDAVAVF